MTCTLLMISLLSISPAEIDAAINARETNRYNSLDLSQYELSEPYDQRVTLVADDGRIALIELPDGARVFTRSQHDLKGCNSAGN